MGISLKIPDPWEIIKGAAKDMASGIWNTGAISPKMVYEFGKGVLQGTAQAGASVGLELHNRLLSKAFNLPEVKELEMPKALQPLFGKAPVESVTTQIEKFPERAAEFGIPKPFSEKIGPPLIIGLTAMNFMPGGKAKEEVGEQVFTKIAQLSNKAEIATELKNFIQGSDTVVDDLAEKLIRPSTVTDVKNTITQFFKEGGPVTAIKNKIVNLIGQSQVTRTEAEQMMSKELSQRVGKASVALKQEGSAVEAFRQAKGQLAGAYAKPEFAPIGNKLMEDEVELMVGQIKNFSMSPLEQIRTYDALEKILSGGKIPQTNELELLNRVFGSEITEAVLKQRSAGVKTLDKMVELLNVRKAFMSSFDMSAIFRQGIVTTLSHPIQAAKNIPETFHYMMSEDYFKGAMEAIQSSEFYPLAQKIGLAINPSYTSAVRTLKGLAGKEEAFQTNLLARMKVIGVLVRASERAYVGFLNKTRMDVFENLAQKMIKQGWSPVKNPNVFSDLSKMINSITGRGDLGKTLNEIAPLLNTTFWSPRFVKSRLDIFYHTFNPFGYAAPVQKEFYKTMARYSASVVTILGMAKMAGADVEMNPLSSDFCKIRVGNTRYDITGGMCQYITLVARATTGKTKNVDTKMIRDVIPKDVLETFTANKLSPDASLIWHWATRQSEFGVKGFHLSAEIKNSMPIIWQDIRDAAQSEGLIPALVEQGIPSFFGIGVQTYGQKSTIPAWMNK